MSDRVSHVLSIGKFDNLKIFMITILNGFTSSPFTIGTLYIIYIHIYIYIYIYIMCIYIYYISMYMYMYICIYHIYM